MNTRVNLPVCIHMITSKMMCENRPCIHHRTDAVSFTPSLCYYKERIINIPCEKFPISIVSERVQFYFIEVTYSHGSVGFFIHQESILDRGFDTCNSCPWRFIRKFFSRSINIKRHLYFQTKSICHRPLIFY